jgi:hypothetical protein
MEFTFESDYSDIAPSDKVPAVAGKDGIFRCDPTKSPEGKYVATLRFLPFIKSDGTKGRNILEKHIHYAKNMPISDLNGYYDCQQNIEEGMRCDMCKLFFKYVKSTDQLEKDKADLIKRTAKYYAYVYVVDDNTNPDQIGKTLLLPFGVKINEKILAEENGENDEAEKCKIFDLIEGKDFKLVCKKVGGFNNYDASKFVATAAPFKYRDAEGKLKPVPFYEDEKTGRKIPGVEGSPEKTAKVHEKLKAIMMDRTSDMLTFASKIWTQDQSAKVEKILTYLTSGQVMTNPTASFESKSDPFPEVTPSKPESKETAKTAEFNDDFDF